MKAAQAGSFIDAYALAHAYEKGTCGLKADNKQMLAWYLRAAQHGYVLAAYRLGEIYFTGAMGAPDYVEAKKWYLVAAEKGHGLSQLRLAYLYAEAHFKGLTVDYNAAEKWFTKAAEQDAGDARFRLGNFYHNYKNPPDLKKAVYWLTLAAQGGNRVAMFDLARMLQKGEGAPANPGEGLKWMTNAAERGMLSAEMTLSEMYASGDGAPKDPVKSLYWTLKVAAMPTALPFWIDKAADILFTGWDTVAQDYTQARQLYERAAAKNDAHALERLGEIYTKGLGVPPEPLKGRDDLKRAKALGDPAAADLLLGKNQ